jgi:hypothetical protein
MVRFPLGVRVWLRLICAWLSSDTCIFPLKLEPHSDAYGRYTVIFQRLVGEVDHRETRGRIQRKCSVASHADATDLKPAAMRAQGVRLRFVGLLRFWQLGFGGHAKLRLADFALAVLLYGRCGFRCR